MICHLHESHANFFKSYLIRLQSNLSTTVSDTVIFSGKCRPNHSMPPPNKPHPVFFPISSPFLAYLLFSSPLPCLPRAGWTITPVAKDLNSFFNVHFLCMALWAGPSLGQPKTKRASWWGLVPEAEPICICFPQEYPAALYVAWKKGFFPVLFILVCACFLRGCFCFSLVAIHSLATPTWTSTCSMLSRPKVMQWVWRS